MRKQGIMLLWGVAPSLQSVHTPALVQPVSLQFVMPLHGLQAPSAFLK